ncbi:hypothetical protein BDA96_09G097500 [Sorghum bicolor]|uniref:Jacalin-type lectin domain-containing protein n=1 Tax=Sorghum bicolor TaxID=4558 RepID=A0A921QAS4_SORBI|nr:hypothetical protein BDA96_09G097500 [Sorghum bicolor]
MMASIRVHPRFFRIALGGAGGMSDEVITLGPHEYVTEVAGSDGPIGELTHTITSLKFVTNHTTYGPFGRGDGTSFNVPVLNNDNIVGKFARADQYLDAIGFYTSSRSDLILFVRIGSTTELIQCTTGRIGATPAGRLNVSCFSDPLVCSSIILFCAFWCSLVKL